MWSIGSIHQICIDWRHLWEMLAAGRKIYAELKNVCVWNKTNAGMGSFYRSKHELVFVWKSGTSAHINNFELSPAEAAPLHGTDGRAVSSHVPPDTPNQSSPRGITVPERFPQSGIKLSASSRPSRPR